MSLALGVDRAIGFPGHERYTRSVAEPCSKADYCNSFSLILSTDFLFRLFFSFQSSALLCVLLYISCMDGGIRTWCNKFFPWCDLHVKGMDVSVLTFKHARIINVK